MRATIKLKISVELFEGKSLMSRLKPEDYSGVPKTSYWLRNLSVETYAPRHNVNFNPLLRHW